MNLSEGKLHKPLAESTSPREFRSERRIAHLYASLAWRNLWRNPRRTGITLAAIIVCTASMLVVAAFMRGISQQVAADAIANLTGHIQIHAPAYRDDPVVMNSLFPPMALGPLLREEGVAGWAARVRVPALIISERESLGVTLAGVDPSQERISFISKAVSQGRNVISPQDNGLILGEALAQKLNTGVGKRVVVMSQGKNGASVERGFRVVGLYKVATSALEERYIFTGRETAQTFLGMGGKISEISLVLTREEMLQDWVKTLQQAAPGMEVSPWMHLEPAAAARLKIADSLIGVWYVVAFVSAAFGLINALLMTVFERTREIGLLLALGMRGRRIFSQITLEAAFLLVAGLVFANAAAWVLLAALSGGVDISLFSQGGNMVGIGQVIYPRMTVSDAVAANVMVLLLGIVASFYPAWRAARYVPITAISRN